MANHTGAASCLLLECRVLWCPSARSAGDLEASTSHGVLLHAREYKLVPVQPQLNMLLSRFLATMHRSSSCRGQAVCLCIVQHKILYFPGMQFANCLLMLSWSVLLASRHGMHASCTAFPTPLFSVSGQAVSYQMPPGHRVRCLVGGIDCPCGPWLLVCQRWSKPTELSDYLHGNADMTINAWGCNHQHPCLHSMPSED